MRRNFIYTASLILSACLLNCTPKKVQENSLTVPDAAHTSQNSLDWSGTYLGLLPCASCPGIEYEIKLYDNLSYLVNTRYQDDKDSTVYKETGTFEWTADGLNVVLTDAKNAGQTRYKVGENKIFRLDADGQLITGNLADFYVLKKTGTPESLDKIFWKLIELNGNKISAAENQPIAFLEFDTNKNRVHGNAGCNIVNGSYEFGDNDKLSFSKMATTLMACPNMETEQQFLNAIENTVAYETSDDFLSLKNTANKVLAKFEAVYIY